ncbi:MAG TPA: tRNA (adenosine(37)-N6)-threonylcarbamoyltransferase complex ATPase subunit type 1 TsaE [Dongiaceae bacterium]|nr:tRNA (adenosine(37)-N6)-threonylcarbamoyltransferase complex ATPase subunit type 1 TsaE [Dongiaceae bacterium]
MATCTSHSPAETESIGEAWGREAQRGLVIGLCGDLGAGKTQLVKGLARGLGITARVQSPTFALVNIYAGGRLTLFHLDLYRLDTPEQVFAAGLGEYLEPEGVTVIEWAEKLGEAPSAQPEGRGPGILPACRAGSAASKPSAEKPSRWRWAQIETVGETERRVIYEDFGG